MNPSSDNFMFDTIKRSGKFSLTKKLLAFFEQNIQTTIVATRFENGIGKILHVCLA